MTEQEPAITWVHNDEPVSVRRIEIAPPEGLKSGQPYTVHIRDDGQGNIVDVDVQPYEPPPISQRPERPSLPQLIGSDALREAADEAYTDLRYMHSPTDEYDWAECPACGNGFTQSIDDYWLDPSDHEPGCPYPVALNALDALRRGERV